MPTIAIEPVLQTRLNRLAQSMGKSPEEMINEAIGEYLARVSEQQLDLEIHAFEQMHADLKDHYFGQFVAIYEGQVVDADADFEPLFLRMQARFDDLTVLIRQVGDLPGEEWYFRSPNRPTPITPALPLIIN